MKQLTILILLFIGASLHSQDVYKDKFSAAGKTIIGIWIESPEVASASGAMKVALYTKNNKYYMALIDNDGYIEKSLNRKKVGNTSRYYDNGSSFEEYYIIDSQVLKVYDFQGYIATYKKSKL